MFDLRAFLRRSPKPRKIRIVTEDGEEREIDLGKGRTRWAATEQTVLTSGAVSVQCLAEDGTITRAQKLRDDDDDDDNDAPTDKMSKAVDRAVGRERRELAGVLDAYGTRLNQAFDRGSASAGSSQDKLIELVEVLTTHLTVAITNVNNLSVSLSNAIQASASGSEDGNPNVALLGQFLGMAMAKGNASPAPANGKGK